MSLLLGINTLHLLVTSLVDKNAFYTSIILDGALLLTLDGKYIAFADFVSEMFDRVQVTQMHLNHVGEIMNEVDKEIIGCALN